MVTKAPVAERYCVVVDVPAAATHVPIGLVGLAHRVQFFGLPPGVEVLLVMEAPRGPYLPLMEGAWTTGASWICFRRTAARLCRSRLGDDLGGTH